MVQNTPILISLTLPASEPVSLAEVKAHLRIDSSDEDTLLSSMITAVRQAAERYLRQSMITQEWQLAFNQYAPASVILPMGPVTVINRVAVISRTDEETMLDSEHYYLDAGYKRLVFDASPLGHRVEIDYQAGYADAGSVPEPLRRGMLVHLAALYEGRAGETLLPAQALELYAPYRDVRI